MVTYTPEQYKAKYGDTGAWANLPNQPATGSRPSIGETIANSFKAGVDKIKSGFDQAAQPGGNPINLLEGVGKIGSGAVGAVFSPLAPITEPTIGAGEKFIADKISDIPAVQKFADSKAGQATARVAEDVGNYSDIAGTVGGAMEVPKVSSAVKTGVSDAIDTTKSAVSNATEKISPSIKSAIQDIKPTSEGIINHQVTKALDLTQGDVKNISLATGNEVGKFMADNNLIGENVATSQAKLKSFYKQNYDAVRAEIAKVTKSYKESNIPRYTEALTELKKQVSDVAGLQEANAEINALLKKAGKIDKEGNFVPNKKATIALNDVQKVKELMDDHYSLYKATGDVKEGVAKEGLANIRKDLKVFIEKQVKDSTGADIKKLNNNVQTVREITDAIKARSTRGLTRSNLTLSDLSLFTGGSITGTPLFGAALVLAKKIFESPSIRLRIAKYLDDVSDAKKAAIQSELQAGKVPTEINKLVKP